MHLIEEQTQTLRQAWHQVLHKQAQASPPAVLQNPLASVGSVPCAPRTELLQTPVNPAATAVHAGPSVEAETLSAK